MNGNNPMPASKCYIVIGFSSIPATHLRLLLCGFSSFKTLCLMSSGAKLCCQENSRGNQLLRHLPSICEALGQITNRKCWPTLVILAVWGWRQVDQKFKVIISFAGRSRPVRAARFETLFRKQTKREKGKKERTNMTQLLAGVTVAYYSPH